MSVVQIPNLPVASTLTGAELLELVQAGVSVRATTQDVANLAAPILAFDGYNGSFCDVNDQVSGGVTTANVASFGTTINSDGVSVTSSTRITAANAGVYLLQFSLQASTSSSGENSIDVWVAKNGSNVSNSNVRNTLTAANQTISVNGQCLVSLAALAYVEVCWSSADASMQLSAFTGLTSPSRPSVPSAYATLTLVQQS